MIGNRFSIGVLKVSVASLPMVVDIIRNAINNNMVGFVCVTNSRTAYLSNRNQEYCRIQNNSLLTVPDGTPLVWIAHNLGFKEVGRVSGPDLLDAILNISEEKGYSHYFYGSTPHTIAQIAKKISSKHPNLEIKRAISPPFQPIEQFDIEGLAEEINRLKPTFFWCGLGAPKQEYLMSLLQPKLESTICIGVGLAFEYLAGTVKRSPLWMQKCGLEWLYRLAQQPKNIRRALKPFFWITKQLFFSYFKR